jgi:hypothetical protein
MSRYEIEALDRIVLDKMAEIERLTQQLRITEDEVKWLQDHGRIPQMEDALKDAKLEIIGLLFYCPANAAQVQHTIDRIDAVLGPAQRKAS